MFVARYASDTHHVTFYGFYRDLAAPRTCGCLWRKRLISSSRSQLRYLSSVIHRRRAFYSSFHPISPRKFLRRPFFFYSPEITLGSSSTIRATSKSFHPSRFHIPLITLPGEPAKPSSQTSNRCCTRLYDEIKLRARRESGGYPNQGNEVTEIVLFCFFLFIERSGQMEITETAYVFAQRRAHFRMSAWEVN